MKMPKRSAALLVFRLPESSGLEVLIVHMGGPFWAKKNARGWSIPKGEYEEGEDPLAAALREFAEELGSPPPTGQIIELGDKRQPSGKVIRTYAVEGDFDASEIRSNTFELEWPKGSGRVQEFPEVDRASWMTAGQASQMLVKGQVPIIEALADYLRDHGTSTEQIARSFASNAAETLF